MGRSFSALGLFGETAVEVGEWSLPHLVSASVTGKRVEVEMLSWVTCHGSREE